MNKRISTIAALVAVCLTSISGQLPANAASTEDFASDSCMLLSPDGNLGMEFILDKGVPYYKLDYRDKPVVMKSRLGFVKAVSALYWTTADFSTGSKLKMFPDLNMTAPGSLSGERNRK